MSQLILNRGVSSRKSIFAKILPNVEFGSYFLIASLIFFVALITVTTLVFSTRQVTKGYVLNSLEAQHQDLVKEREVNDMEISKVRALNYIQNSSEVRRMVVPRMVVFVEGETAIASK
jgi:hypothetical protein